jgi:hypothetical protein
LQRVEHIEDRLKGSHITNRTAMQEVIGEMPGPRLTMEIVRSSGRMNTATAGPLRRTGNPGRHRPFRLCTPANSRRLQMGRSILLWLVGVPIPIIILLALFWR